jgi:hypothetical protein
VSIIDIVSGVLARVAHCGNFEMVPFFSDDELYSVTSSELLQSHELVASTKHDNSRVGKNKSMQRKRDAREKYIL